MHEEGQTLDLLKQLCASQTSNIPDTVKQNSEQFLKLISGVDSNHATESHTEESSEAPKTKKKKAHKNKGSDTAKRKTFIERNIELAKCGQGILSLTDAEKARLNSLLKEIESESKECKNTSLLSEGSSSGLEGTVSVMECESGLSIEPLATDSENSFCCVKEARDLLSQIDSKLQVYERVKKSEYFPKLTRALSESVTETDVDENEKERSMREEEVSDDKETQEVRGKRAYPVKDNAYRLKEVDLLLKDITAVFNQVVNPLPEGDIQILLEEALHWSAVLPGILQEAGTRDTPCTPTLVPLNSPTADDIAQLVESAKTSMPKYQYRFTEA